MRLGQVRTPSILYYDRTPTTPTRIFHQILAPAPPTQAIAYYPAPGNLALVTLVTLALRRVTAPTTAGLVSLWVEIQAAGQVITTGAVVGSLFHSPAGVEGDAVYLTLPLNILITENTQVAVFYNDTSTGGAVDYFAAIVANEFSK